MLRKSPAVPENITSTKRWNPGTMHGDGMKLVELASGVLPHVNGLSDTQLLSKRMVSGGRNGNKRRREHADAEWRVSRIFNRVMPGIAPDCWMDADKMGVTMRWVENGEQYHWGDTLDSAQRFDAGVINALDSLVGNTDRHGGNVVMQRGKMWAIDHSICFEYGIFNHGYRAQMISDTIAASNEFQAGEQTALERVIEHADWLARTLNARKRRPRRGLGAYKRITGDDVRQWAQDELAKRSAREERKAA